MAFAWVLRGLQQRQNWRQQELESVTMSQGYTGVGGSVACPPSHSVILVYEPVMIHMHTRLFTCMWQMCV